MSEIDRIEMCAQALVLIGEAPIDSFEGNTTAQVVASQRYGAVATMLLSEHPWDFNRKAQPLVASSMLQSKAELMGFTHGYNMPTDCYWLEVPTIGGYAIEEWEIAEGALFLCATDDDAVGLRYHGMVDEALWPPKFREAVVYWLAAEFAVPLTEDDAKSTAMRQVAVALRREAKHQNATRSPPAPIRTGRFAVRKIR